VNRDERIALVEDIVWEMRGKYCFPVDIAALVVDALFPPVEFSGLTDLIAEGHHEETD
jgi:hypothetical protein